MRSSIRVLDLSHSTLSDTEFELLFDVLPNTKINVLTLPFCEIADSGVDIISAGLAFTKLVKLDLSYNKIGNGALRLMQSVRDTEIKILHLSANRIPTDIVDAIVELVPATKLTALYLDDYDEDDYMGDPYFVTRTNGTSSAWRWMFDV